MGAPPGREHICQGRCDMASGVMLFVTCTCTCALLPRSVPPPLSGRRKVVLGAALSAVANEPASANDLQDRTGWSAGRDANLEKMNARYEEKEALCAGRRAVDLQERGELSNLDMTWDPPCYISGYYEVLAAGAILGGLKLGQVAEERKESKAASQLVEAAAAREDAPDAPKTGSRSDQSNLRMQLDDEEIERKLASMRRRGPYGPRPERPSKPLGLELANLLDSALGLEFAAVLFACAAVLLSLAVGPLINRL